MLLTRSQVRRAVLTIANQKTNTLDKKEKEIAEAVLEAFQPYVGGNYGWLAFTFTWDLHPDLALPAKVRLDEQCVHVQAEGGLVRLEPEAWPEWIITALEFKAWRARWNELYGKKLHPPCMTRQELVNGG
jgi:hypothetical protein